MTGSLAVELAPHNITVYAEEGGEVLGSIGSTALLAGAIVVAGALSNYVGTAGIAALFSWCVGVG